MKTSRVQIEYIKDMTNNDRYAIKILFFSSRHYYKPVSRTSQIMGNITEDENTIKSVLVTVNDLPSKLNNEKFKIDKNLHY